MPNKKQQKNPSELASQLNKHMPPKPKNQRRLNNWFYLCIDDGKSSAGLPSSVNREELVRESEKHVVHISNKNTKIREYFMDESLFRNNSPGGNDELVWNPVSEVETRVHSSFELTNSLELAFFSDF